MAPSLALPNQRTIPLDRPLIMGILNVTPDSFSDGGQYTSIDAAVAHAQQMLADGADIIDVGGESTRPGSRAVSPSTQIQRVVPVIEAVCRRVPEAVVSIDTTRASVAQAALDAGAVMINDVSAGRDDPAVFKLAAQRGAPIVLVHMQGPPQTMQLDPHYEDVVAQVVAFLTLRAQEAESAGLRHQQILIDPGIGFGKTTDHNLVLLGHLHCMVATGYPVLLGTSRKRFLGQLCPERLGQPLPPEVLTGATCATTALGVAAGVSVFRVHDVRPNRQAADVARAIKKTQNDA